MAFSLNRAMIIGNLTRDPETRSTPSGQNVCNFSVATSRQWTDNSGAKQEQAEYHNVVAWAKLADIASQYLTKGRKVYVEGRIQTREWQAQDGSKKFRTEIVAENLILLDRAGAPAGGGTGGGNWNRVPAAGKHAQDAAPQEDPNVQPVVQAPPNDEIRVEDIPF